MRPVTLKMTLSDGEFLTREGVLDFRILEDIVTFSIEKEKSASFPLRNVKYWELV